MTKQKKSAEVEILKNQLARTLADYDNLEKRVERQSLELYLNASSRIVKQLLPILDMIGDAQKHLQDAGLAITIKEFEEVLFGEGYKKIFPGEGEEFNETKHEAVDVVETENENEDNTVASVTLTGWEFGEGSIIRPAKVVVKKFKN